MLTAQRQRFCQEYIIDLNGTAAAIRADYAQSNARAQASRLLKHPEVAARIAELMASRSAAVEVTQTMVIEGLLKEARHEGEGSTHSARVTAWTNLGKHLGMFRERFEFNSTNLNVDLNDLSPDELAQLAAGEPLASILKRRPR